MDKFKTGDKVRLRQGITLPGGPHSLVEPGVVYEVIRYSNYYRKMELNVQGRAVVVLEDCLERVDFPGMPDEYEQPGPIAVIESFY